MFEKNLKCKEHKYTSILRNVRLSYNIEKCISALPGRMYMST